MNTVVTSKEEILKTSRELLQKQGWSAVNIRSVAAACDVSVGSIYNYFASKTELVGAIVESVWCEIFHRPEKEEAFQDIRSCIVWMYERMEYGCKQYPVFLRSTRWALCRRTNRMAGGGCRKPGSIFCPACVPSSSGTPISGPMPLMNASQPRSARMFCSH